MQGGFNLDRSLVEFAISSILHMHYRSNRHLAAATVRVVDVDAMHSILSAERLGKHHLTVARSRLRSRVMRLRGLAPFIWVFAHHQSSKHELGRPTAAYRVLNRYRKCHDPSYRRALYIACSRGLLTACSLISQPLC